MRHLRTLHRWIGLFVALFVIQISITGILLNHTDDLELDKKHVQSSYVLDWYGLKPTITTSFKLDAHWFIESDGAVFASAKRIGNGSLKAVARCGPFYCIQLDTNVLILNKELVSVDQLVVPTGAVIGQAGLNTLGASTGKTHYVCADLLNWQQSDQPVAASQPTVLSAEAEESLRQAITAKTLPWERVVQDMHSGRILGDIGVWIVDIFAVFLVLLAISGLWMWARVYRANK